MIERTMASPSPCPEGSLPTRCRARWNGNLLNYMTAVQNVVSAMEITGARGGRKKERAAQILTRLGVETAGEIIAVFRALAHEEGKCVVVVTRSREVAAAADHVLRLRSGMLVKG